MQQQRGQRFGMLAIVGVAAAMVARACWLISDEAERRLCDLGGRGRLCSRCVILVSCSCSFARLPEAFRTLGGCVLAYVASCTRACAAAVVAWPL